MGAKIQEEYIEKIRSKVNISLLMGVGGSFDAFIGNAPRAPKWMFENWFRMVVPAYNATKKI